MREPKLAKIQAKIEAQRLAQQPKEQSPPPVVTAAVHEAPTAKIVSSDDPVVEHLMAKFREYKAKHPEEFLPKVKQKSKSKIAGEMSMRCPNGHSVIVGAFCTECGVKLVDDRKRCPKCGGLIFPANKFCATCGVEIEQKVEQK